jgi:putative endonuclease
LLIYYEKFVWIEEAIAREKEIKKWRRDKKTIFNKRI